MKSCRRLFALRGILQEMKEAWDFDAFVRAYNQLAKQRSGWVWPGEIPEAKLRGWYQEAGPLWDTLGEFAQTRYELDQEV